ncbi:MAG TPA: hypothetical protein VGG64_21970 [Pirellulales bacterium]
MWRLNDPIVQTYARLGKVLAESSDLFRNAGPAGGLILIGSGRPTQIIDAGSLSPAVIERCSVVFVGERKAKCDLIPIRHLSGMLGTDAFLNNFRPLDRFVRMPMYLPDWSLSRPGYNDGGPGHRMYYDGVEAKVSEEIAGITAFLDVMAFASNADRTNAVAAALTVMLRNHFLGAKPVLAVTATKSHGGKDTIIAFARGETPHSPISYQSTDWALERAIVGAFGHDPDLGMLVIDNARRGNNGPIQSAILERLATDAKPLLYSTGRFRPERRVNDFVIAMSTNEGSISEDLMNRALPIHLAPIGDVADRQSPIGNPKLEYLPKHANQIAAELRGMIERWKVAGQPLDTGARHPFTAWAGVVGGILKANGFTDFLGNYAVRRTSDDPVRVRLALLGAERPDQWLTATEWATVAVDQGVKDIVPVGDRTTLVAQARGMGVVLSRHQDEKFVHEGEHERLALRLTKARTRDKGEPAVRYRFAVEERADIGQSAQ